MELFFDTETSGTFNYKAPTYWSEDFPWCVQLGAVLAEDGIAYAEINVLIRADGRKISDDAARTHQITTEESERLGVKEDIAARVFVELWENADLLVAHNYSFDSYILAGIFHRQDMKLSAESIIAPANMGGAQAYCTMLETVDLCKLPGKYGFKWPKLQELHEFLFGEKFTGAHDAMFDIRATMKCFYKLKEDGWIK